MNRGLLAAISIVMLAALACGGGPSLPPDCPLRPGDFAYFDEAGDLYDRFNTLPNTLDGTPTELRQSAAASRRIRTAFESLDVPLALASIHADTVASLELNALAHEAAANGDWGLAASLFGRAADVFSAHEGDLVRIERLCDLGR